LLPGIRSEVDDETTAVFVSVDPLMLGFTWKTSVKAADALEASVVSVQFTEPVAPAGGFVQGKITRIEQKLRGES
jgi:hypothetical protein